jgi:hypothetical protein
LTQSFAAAAASEADVVIRHLVVPGHVDCCTRPALQWARNHFPQIPFHLMYQYRPDYRALRDPVIGRPPTGDEIAAAEAAATEAGVLRYRRDAAAEAGALARLTVNPADNGIGDSIEISVLPDGRIGFHRLAAKLIPLARSMSAGPGGMPVPTGVSAEADVP